MDQVFAAEVGEPRGRREFNILGDVVNIASRLTSAASPNQVLLTESVYHQVASAFSCTSMGCIFLKGKAQSTAVYAVSQPKHR
ncbi:MAG: adenylate/guanylate cyclase domain-containing protein [Synechococcales cyanobacterium T60_A2020_003]|nr:adenylate/guanylate cyclase domain-containing protein [Synechococcales cyanobacterium T60_A2020_003]